MWLHKVTKLVNKGVANLPLTWRGSLPLLILWICELWDALGAIGLKKSGSKQELKARLQLAIAMEREKESSGDMAGPEEICTWWSRKKSWVRVSFLQRCWRLYSSLFWQWAHPNYFCLDKRIWRIVSPQWMVWYTQGRVCPSFVAWISTIICQIPEMWWHMGKS